MAQVLGPGETMNVGETRTDETGRFQLRLQTDGNLVIYTHVLKPEPRGISTGDTRTHGIGSDVELHLTHEGLLQLRRRSNHKPYHWKAPSFLPPAPGSTLHLQADGNLCLYRPNIFPGNVTWTMGQLLDFRQSQVVRADALILEVGNGAYLPDFTQYVRNETGRVIEAVTKDGNGMPVQVAPNSLIGVKQTGGAPMIGTLSFPSWPPSYADGSGTSDEAVPAAYLQFSPGQFEIRATMGSDGSLSLS